MLGLKHKSYLPQPSRPGTSDSDTIRPFHPPTGPSAEAHRPGNIGIYGAQHNGRSGAGQSLKRRYHERETSEPRDARAVDYGSKNSGRSSKQTRKGPSGFRGGLNHGQSQRSNGLPPGGFALPNLLLPPFGAANSKEWTQAMQAVQSMGLPGMLPMPPGTSYPFIGDRKHTHDPQLGSRTRCYDYDQKGFCALGALCPL
jgi:hypothetical protein